MKHINQRLENQEILLDGNEFVNCRFKHCQLQFGGVMPISLSDCDFDSCTFIPIGPAANALNFLGAIYQMGNGGEEVVAGILHAITGGKGIQPVLDSQEN